MFMAFPIEMERNRHIVLLYFGIEGHFVAAAAYVKHTFVMARKNVELTYVQARHIYDHLEGQRSRHSRRIGCDD